MQSVCLSQNSQNINLYGWRGSGSVKWNLMKICQFLVQTWNAGVSFLTLIEIRQNVQRVDVFRTKHRIACCDKVNFDFDASDRGRHCVDSNTKKQHHIVSHLKGLYLIKPGRKNIILNIFCSLCGIYISSLLINMTNYQSNHCGIDGQHDIFKG